MYKFPQMYKFRVEKFIFTIFANELFKVKMKNCKVCQKYIIFWVKKTQNTSKYCSQIIQGTKVFQYCNCPAGRVTYNFHLSCKHMHLSFKSICNKAHNGVICYTCITSLSNSSQSTCPTGRELWEELLVLSRFHS